MLYTSLVCCKILYIGHNLNYLQCLLSLKSKFLSLTKLIPLTNTSDSRDAVWGNFRFGGQILNVSWLMGQMDETVGELCLIRRIRMCVSLSEWVNEIVLPCNEMNG